MSVHNPKCGRVFRFYVKHGAMRPKLMNGWAPDEMSAEAWLHSEYPAAKITRAVYQKKPRSLNS